MNATDTRNDGIDAQESTAATGRRCSICGWTQTAGRGETVLCCPDCGGSSWEVAR